MKGLFAITAMLAIGCLDAVTLARPALAQGPGSSGATGDSAPTVPGSATPGAPASGSAATAPGGAGVIAPPAAIDPGIKRAPPATEKFTMPVVPPPGTPGGKPGVVAK